jgi:hypothetical protein
MQCIFGSRARVGAGGHTAPAPLAAQKRAGSVMQSLEDACGVDPARMTASGYGFARHKYPRGSRKSGLNRRIEVLVRQVREDTDAVEEEDDESGE